MLKNNSNNSDNIRFLCSNQIKIKHAQLTESERIGSSSDLQSSSTSISNTLVINRGAGSIILHSKTIFNTSSTLKKIHCESETPSTVFEPKTGGSKELGDAKITNNT